MEFTDADSLPANRLSNFLSPLANTATAGVPPRSRDFFSRNYLRWHDQSRNKNSWSVSERNQIVWNPGRNVDRKVGPSPSLLRPVSQTGVTHWGEREWAYNTWTLNKIKVATSFPKNPRIPRRCPDAAPCPFRQTAFNSIGVPSSATPVAGWVESFCEPRTCVGLEPGMRYIDAPPPQTPRILNVPSHIPLSLDNPFFVV